MLLMKRSQVACIILVISFDLLMNFDLALSNSEN